MAQVLVRNLKDNVVARLKKRAQTRGRSLQAEVKMILEKRQKKILETFGRKPIESVNGSNDPVERSVTVPC